MTRERELWERQRFLDYVASGKATAIDLVIRNSADSILLTKRSEPPFGLHFPGSIKLPGEPALLVIDWITRKELKFNLVNALKLDDAIIRNKFLGHTREQVTDEIRDPRGPVGHDVYEFVIDGLPGNFFDNIPQEIIPQHRRIIEGLGIKFGR